MSRFSSRFASGFRRTPLTTLKMAALAPMPRPSVMMTVMASPLTRDNDRSAKRRSVITAIGYRARGGQIHSLILRDDPYRGVIAITRSGLPLPLTILRGAAITTAPVGG